MNNKKTSIVSLLVGIILAVGVGVLCGLALVWHMNRSGYGTGSALIIMSALLALVLALLLQIIIHELGHLVFGLLSGYEFCSLCLGLFAVTKDASGKICVQKAPRSSLASQCLMAPPDIEEDGYLPTGLYTMGGVIFNAFTAIIFLWAYFVCSGASFLPFFYLSMNVLGLGFVILNLIPLSIDDKPNDGYVLHYLDEDDDTITQAYWAQLKINQQLYQGKQLEDMPDELFRLPDFVDRNNPIVIAAELLFAKRKSI